MTHYKPGPYTACEAAGPSTSDPTLVRCHLCLEIAYRRDQTKRWLATVMLNNYL